MSEVTVMMALPLLADKATIKADQDGIRLDLKSLDARIHINAVQCLLHAEKHGDTSLMRRLLIDIVDDKSGYRRQGLIGWMKAFSPMRLEKDVIKLNGIKEGIRQAFECEKAYNSPFTTMTSLNEKIAFKPIFRDGMTSKIERVVKEYKDAVANTVIVPGKGSQPKTIGKPFYNGVHMDKIEASFDKINGILAEITAFSDSSKDVYQSKLALARAQLDVDVTSSGPVTLVEPEEEKGEAEEKVPEPAVEQ